MPAIYAVRPASLRDPSASLARFAWRRRTGEAAAEAVKGEPALACAAADGAAGLLRRARPAEMAARESALGKRDRRGRFLRLLLSVGSSQTSSGVVVGTGGPPTEEETTLVLFSRNVLFSTSSKPSSSSSNRDASMLLATARAPSSWDRG